VEVILRHVPTNEMHILLTTNFSDEITHSLPYAGASESDDDIL
jgi:hypothetical protein